MKTSIDLIAEERSRHQSIGYDAAHDDVHREAELSRAGVCYANLGWLGPLGYYANHAPPDWPFEPQFWKPSSDPVRNLVKGAALIAAEIDRLLRIEEEDPS